MIISHSKEFCYWKIARTGSNSIEMAIRLSGVLDPAQDIATHCHFLPYGMNVSRDVSGHLMPHQAIEQEYLTQEQFDEYNHYTIVRDPTERFCSAFSLCGAGTEPVEDWYAHFPKDVHVMIPQSQYLTGGRVKTFPFSEYERSARSILRLVGAEYRGLPHLKHPARSGAKLRARIALEDEKFRGLVHKRYADDFSLEC